MHIYAFLLNINTPLFVNGFPKNVPKKRIFSQKHKFGDFSSFLGKFLGREKRVNHAGLKAFLWFSQKQDLGNTLCPCAKSIILILLMICKKNYPF